MGTHTFIGLAATRRGQTQQLTKGYRGMADEMKRRQAEQPADCDQPQTLEAALRVIASLQSQLADAQSLIADMRAEANSDAPEVTVKTWTTRMVANVSRKSIATICRNASQLGGTQLPSGDWVFPVGTQYAGKRKRQ